MPFFSYILDLLIFDDTNITNFQQANALTIEKIIFFTNL